MSNVTEQDQFDSNVYQLDLTDPVLGGPTGPSNKAAINLANRTRWLFNALRFGRGTFAAESGTANHYVANIASAPTTLEEGMEVRFQAVNANTGASDFTPNSVPGGIAVLPIYGADHNPLQGGEIAALGEVTLRYTSKLNTGGGGAWILIRSTGGIQRSITPSVGDATNAVATMLSLFNAADGMATVSVAGGSDVTLTAAQYGCAILKLTGTPTANINLKLPAQTGQWIIINSQGGTFNVTAKTTAGGSTGVVIPASSGTAVLVFSDGTNVNFASSAGQSSFRRVTITGVTSNPVTVSGGYTPGGVMVEKNGLWLEPSQFVATDGATMTFTPAPVSSDQYNVYAFGTFNVPNAVLRSGDTMGGPLNLAGGDTAVTTAQFDNSTAPATTAFVKRQGLQAAGVSVISATGGLSASVIGGTVIGNAASAITLTLPAANSVPAGARIEFLNINTGAVTVQRAGADSIFPNSTAVSSVVLGNGDSVTLESNGTNSWYAVDGSVQLGSSAAFASSLVSNGSQRLPSGLIIKMGTSGAISAGGSLAITFASAFPNGMISALCANSYSAGGSSITSSVGLQYSGITGFTIFNAGTAGVSGVPWIAIGY